jgi:hypothetical protein
VEPPTGFQLDSVEDEPFYLYVPNTWTSNASSGISSAYYSSSGNRILVSAFAQKDEGDTSLQLYTAKTLETFQRSLDDFDLASELEETTLGSYAAYTFDYKATSDKKTMRFRTYVSEYAEGFAVLTYSAEQEVFEKFEEDFKNIVAKFSFKVENTESVETKKPQQAQDEIDGWQLASSSAYEFDFFVPKSWTVDKASEIPTATCSSENGDNSNVTMMSYVLSAPTTAKAYWEQIKEELIYDYEVIATDENVKLGGLSAYAVEYKTGLADMMYHVKQVFCATSNMMYVFTYTSNDTYYESHLNSVDAMLTMFAFN